MRTADHLLRIGAELGEGSAWIDGLLWFVDIRTHQIFRHDPGSGETDRWDAPEPVGWILPSKHGDFIAGLASGPHRFTPESGAFESIVRVDAEHPDNRLNDAAVDRAGRIHFGSMDNRECEATGRVFLLDAGKFRATDIPPVVITNGPAIPPAGDRLYHVDTLGRALSVHAIGDDGLPGPGRSFLTFEDGAGYPDGAICDAEGGIWVCFYGGWAARRYDREGRQSDEVLFPVANVTKLALGGPDGRTAYVTTARQGLSSAELAQQPLAGDIFTFRADVPGVPQNLANS